MHLVRSVIPVLGTAAFTATALADVTIVSRLSELHQSQASAAPFPPSFSDNVSTTALGPVTLTTDHGQSFTSSVTSQSITAQLHGSSSLGGASDPVSAGTATSIDVVFQVTGAPANISILITSGMSSMISTNPADSPRANAQLRLLDNATNQVLFNSDSIMTVHTGAPWWGDWSNASWTATLAPGTYHINGFANGNYFFATGAGSGGGGSGSMNVQISITPTPGAAAALALLAPVAGRRRRA